MYVCACMCMYTYAHVSLLCEHNYTDPPIVAIEPSQSPNYASTNATLWLHCIAHGYPHPTVQWYQNDTLIKQQYTAGHFLVPTTSNHATVYTCFASNVIRNATYSTSKNVTVIVQGNKRYVNKFI